MICIAGKNNIAVEICKYISKLNITEVCVIPNKTDDGKNGFQRSLVNFAFKNGIKVVSLDDVYNEKDLIFLSLEFDELVKPERFRSNKLFNIHFSLLPEYKGMYTSYWPIRNGEKYSGVTLHKIDFGIDTGDIIDQIKIKIGDNDTCKELYLKYIDIGIQLIKRNIYNLINGAYSTQEQSEVESTYYSKSSLDYSNIKIDLNNTSFDIKNQIRALNFREYQLPIINGSRISHVILTKERSDVKSGTILYEDDDYIKIATIDYNIKAYKDKINEIIDCCRNENVETLNNYIKNGYNLNEQEETHGWTPLIVACYNGKFQIIKMLLDNNVDINRPNYNGTTPIMYAKDYYIRTQDFSILKYLVTNGANLLKEDYEDKMVFEYIKVNFGEEKLNEFISLL